MPLVERCLRRDEDTGLRVCPWLGSSTTRKALGPSCCQDALTADACPVIGKRAFQLVRRDGDGLGVGRHGQRVGPPSHLVGEVADQHLRGGMHPS